MFQPPQRDVEQGLLDGFVRLLGLKPLPRAIAGSAALLAGLVLTVAFWDKGVVWGLTLFLVAAGFFLMASGLLDHLRQKRRAAYVASVLKRQNDIVLAMTEAKKQGRNPVRVLNEQKILDFDLRNQLTDAMAERLRREGFVEAPRPQPVLDPATSAGIPAPRQKAPGGVVDRGHPTPERLPVTHGNYFAAILQLIFISPVPRVIVGMCFLAAAAAAVCCAYFTTTPDMPLLPEMFPLLYLGLLLGLPLAISGLVGLRRTRRYRQARARFEQQKADRVARMVALKRAGGNVLSWMVEQGIVDADERTELHDAMKLELFLLEQKGDPPAPPSVPGSPTGDAAPAVEPATDAAAPGRDFAPRKPSAPRPAPIVLGPGLVAVAGLALLAAGAAIVGHAFLAREPGRSLPDYTYPAIAFFGLFGLPLALFGLIGYRRARRRRQARALFDQNKKERVARMVALKRDGKNVLTWMVEEGIIDADERTELFDAMKVELFIQGRKEPPPAASPPPPPPPTPGAPAINP
jgi:hypothetical protein